MPFKPGEDVTALMQAAPASGADVTAQMTPQPYQPRNILAEGRAAAATDKMSEADYGKLQDPASLSHWFNTELKPMLEKVARPETISDIAALLVPDAAGVVTGARAAFRGAGAAAESAGKAMEAMGASKVAQRVGTYGAGYAALSGNLGKAALAAGAPPALTGAGKVLQSGGRFLQEVGARPVGEAVPVIPPETPAELTARVTAEHRANLPPEAPAAPVAQTPTPAPVASPAPTSSAAAAPEAVSAPIARPDAFRAALKAFETAKETPRAAEASNTAALIMRGKTPEEALAVVLGNRPPSPAAELAKRLGTPSEAEMNADMAARARKGQKSLMPKYGGAP